MQKMLTIIKDTVSEKGLPIWSNFLVFLAVSMLSLIIGVSEVFSQAATGQTYNQTEEVTYTVKAKKRGPSANHYPHPDVWGAELPTETGFIGEISRVNKVFDDTEYFFDDSGRLLIFYVVETDDAIIHRIYDFFDRGVSDEWKIPKRSKFFNGRDVLVFYRDEADANSTIYNDTFSYLRSIDVDDYLTSPVGIEFFLSREEEEINEKNKSLLRLLRESRTRREGDGSILGDEDVSLRQLRRRQLVGECYDTVGVTYKSYYSCCSSFTDVMLVRVFSEPQVLDKRTSGWYDLESVEGAEKYEGKIFYRGRTIQDWDTGYIRGSVFNLGDGTYLLKDYGLPTVIRFYGCLESPYFEERDDLFRITKDDIRDALKDFKYCSLLLGCNLSAEHPSDLLEIARVRCDAAGIFCKEDEEFSYRVKLLEHLDALIVDEIVEHIRKKKALGNEISKRGDKKRQLSK